MIVKRAILGIIGLTALVVSVAIALVALSCALFLALAPVLGQAAAAAIVAMFFILLIVGLALIVAMAGSGKREAEDEGLFSHLFSIATERPLLSAAAAAAAGIIIVRNPAMVATIAAALARSFKTGR